MITLRSVLVSERPGGGSDNEEDPTRFGPLKSTAAGKGGVGGVADD